MLKCVITVALIYALSTATAMAASTTRAELDQEIQQTTVGQAIKRALPKQYDDWLEKIMAVSEDLDAVRRESQAFSAQLVSENAVLVQVSPEPHLIGLLDRQLALIRGVRTTLGRPACGKWQKGDPALAKVFAKRFEDAYTARLVAVFDAIGGALESPVARDSAAPSDWDAFWDFAGARGLTRDQLARFADGSSRLEESCEIYEAYLSNVIALPGPEGDRVRADAATAITNAIASPPQ